MIAASEAAGLAQRPPPIYLEGKLPVVEVALARQLGLRNEQVVQANVESQAGHWQLRFSSGARIDVPHDWPVSQGWNSGDQVQFRVMVQSDGSIMLRPLTDPNALNLAALPGDTVAAQPPLMPDRLAQLLVRPTDMKGLQELLQPGVLEQLARQAGEMPGQLAQWLRNRPSMALLNAEQIRNGLLQSGWFNEGVLGSGRSMPLMDLKTALRALQRSIQANQDGKVRMVDEALDDIESAQLAAISSHLATSFGDLPVGVLMAFRDMPPVRFSIRRENPSPDEGRGGFVVDLQMKTPDLGPIWLRTRILDTSKLDMTMWAVRDDVVALAKSQSQNLRQQLSQAGLQLISLKILQGQAPTFDPGMNAQGPGQVLDVMT